MRKRHHHRHPPSAQVRRRRWRLYLLGLILTLLGVGSFVAIRWRHWYGLEAEAPYVTPPTIERVTLTPGADFSRSRTLSWRCGDSVRPAEVLLSRLSAKGEPLRPERFIPKHEVVTTSGGQDVFYHLTLDSLQQGASYIYRLRLSGVREYRGTFTLPDEERRTSFLFLGDIRDNPPALTHRLFAYLRSSFPSDFYALSGGILSQPTDGAWRDFYHALGGLSTHTPLVVAPGMGEALHRGLSSHLDPRWTAQLVYSANGPEGSLGRSYYIDFPLFRLVVLDTSDLLGMTAIKRQCYWLEETLRGSSQPWRIVLAHHAVDRVEEGEKNLVMHYFFKDALIEAGADLVLQGHDHSYARGSHRSRAGDTLPPLFVVSSASARHERNGFSAAYDRLGSGLLLYQHITVEPDKLTFSAYRFPKDTTESLEKCRYDSVVLRRSSADSLRLEDLARTLPERFDYDRFTADSRGRKKASQYAKEVRDRAAQRPTKK